MVLIIKLWVNYNEKNRDAYADMYGPTTGDKIRLADTELFIELEKDLTYVWRRS